MNFLEMKNPLAIAMWDYSYMERDWDGAGFEDLDKALDEFVARGYNAVRIDAYPHFIYGGNPVIDLIPVRNQQDYGSPINTKIQVQPKLNDFLRKCKARNIYVGLSTWWSLDETNLVAKMADPKEMAKAWLATLESIPKDLFSHIIYLDMSNEFPLRAWTPFYTEDTSRDRADKYNRDYMVTVIDIIKNKYPQLPLTFSEILLDDVFVNEQFVDFIDVHTWMSGGEFYEKINYNYEKFSPVGYQNLQKYGEKTYRENTTYWQEKMLRRIDQSVEQSIKFNKPLICTEGFAVVQYKDYPLLNWDWVMELNEIAVEHALKSKRYYAINTSNFCQPQFRGMWKHIDWHKNLTTQIKTTEIKHIGE